MKKGASTVIIVVLISLIAVSLVIISYSWFFRYSTQTQQVMEKNIGTKEGCLKIESIDTINKKIVVRNCGKTELSNFVVYLDSEPIANSSGKLGAGGVMQLDYNKDISPETHDIKISSDNAESSALTFSIPIEEICGTYINQLPFSITQSNTYYCLNVSANNLATTAITFSSGVQNSTLDCRSYNIDGNDAAGFNGVYLTGSNTKNNTVKNCNITDFWYGIYLYNGPNNNTLTNITANSNYYGMRLDSSNNNTLTNVVANSNNPYGVYLDSSSNNQFTNIMASSNSVGVSLFGTSSNTFTGGSIADNNTDYYLSVSVSDNFTNTNFTATRNIWLDSSSWFNYNNETTGNIWLKTKVSGATTITRKLTNWNQTLLMWKDNSSSTVTANYNITGLVKYSFYYVYNNSNLIYALDSGSKGEINFTIYLSANQEREIAINNATVGNIIWFKFNEANGTTVYDSSGNGNNGVFLGETFNDGRLGDATCNPGSGSCPTRTSNGYFGKALIFDGTNDYVKTPLSNDFDFGDEDFTIGFWMKGDYQYGYGYFFSKNYVSGSGIRWYGCSMVGSTGNGEPANAGKIRLYVNNGTTLAQADTSGYYNDSVWHHVALRRNISSKKLEIFVDGSLDGVYNNFYGNLSNMTSSPQNNFFVGARSDLGTGSNARYFNGTIEEFRVWNRTLNITEINSEMQSSLPAIRPLVSWRFEEDSSSNYTNDTHTWVNGTYGSALSFENDSVNVNDIPNTSLTIMAWIYPQQILGVQRAIVSKWKYPNAADNEWLIRLSNDSTAKIELYIRNITGDQVYTSTTNFIISPNQWSHIAVVYDRETGQVSFYKSGSPVSGGGYVGATWDTAEIVRVGAQGGGTYNYFNGTIDEVKIFNRTLSASEIVTEMNKP